MTTSDDFPLDRFIKLLNMLRDTTSDNEKINAIRLCNAMLARSGLDWERFARGKITIVNDPFSSIAEPPKAAAAPPPPQPTPPQRSPRDTAIVNSRLNLLHNNRHHLRTHTATRLDQITIDWQHHAPNMSDADYSWLSSEAAQFDLKQRDIAEVERYLDVCDLAPLNDSEIIRVRAIRITWQQSQLMCDHDYSFLSSLYRYYNRPTGGPGKRKAKRLF
jgi:hypothetical protein